jgi:hypothetical protein
MSEEHHRVRYFVVRELQSIGKPMQQEFISQSLKLPVERVNTILDELESNLFFLVRNGQGAMGIHPQPARIVLLVILVTSVVLLSACGTKTAQGKITGAYQPLRSGMVQMYIEVELDDGTEVDALLPQDDEIWDKVRESVRRGWHLRVEIQRKGSEASWEYVRFLDD